MKRSTLALFTVACFATVTPLRANVVNEWCEKTSGAAYVMPGGPGTAGVRIVAMAHIAMFEAVNSIEPRYTPYRALLPAERGWSQDAAASAAARADASASPRVWRRWATSRYSQPMA